MIFGVATNEDRRQRSDNTKQRVESGVKLRVRRQLYKSSPQDFLSHWILTTAHWPLPPPGPYISREDKEKRTDKCQLK